ncbi:MAG: ABC transporter permease [Euryarchaeota archaeon]|nr:ABC transporter permease [Euryarchaeota archaeon]
MGFEQANQRVERTAQNVSDGLVRFRGSTRTALLLATRDIVKDKKVTALVICVFAFSFLNVIFFTSFNNGLENTFHDNLVNTFTSHVIIEPKDAARKYITGVESIERKVTLLPGVVAVVPHLDQGITLSFRDKTIGGHMMATVPSKEKRVTLIPSKTTLGEFLSDSDRDQVVLGKFLSGDEKRGESFGFEGLGAEVGDRIRIDFGNGVTREYRVKGILEAGGFNADFNAYLTIKEAESVFGFENRATEILVRLGNRNAAFDYKRQILQQGIQDQVKTWEDKAGFIKEITSGLSSVTAITGFVGVITVAVTMAIVIYINTTYKKRLIGVLKAIGASDGTVLRVFLYEALLFSILGILAGVGLSMLIGEYFTANPIPLPPGPVVPDIRPELLMTTSISILGSAVFAALYPSWKAARQSIIKSIWS